ncbi:MAG: sulfur oxidation c-type cytochrome SoxA [Alphaproteobacteria bacterium]|nr:sulfur oxidation c-type cytochrome SoxA [Alphaproteobacteria bacterium]
MRGRAALVLAALIAAAAAAQAGEVPLNERRSGFEQMKPETKAMQTDDAANPGMLWILDGEAIWSAKAGAAKKSCADCHGDVAESMKGVAACHPAHDAKRNAAVSLSQRIDICRAENQKAPAFQPESRDQLALLALIALQSRGQPIVSDEKNLKPLIAEGRAIFLRRQGHMDLSCAHCHTASRGLKLAGVPLSQGHPTGYPLYRLEWQTFGSLQRRLRNCLIGMRAEPYAFDSREHLALEAYLMWRARGMVLESPAVRP